MNVPSKNEYKSLHNYKIIPTFAPANKKHYTNYVKLNEYESLRNRFHLNSRLSDVQMKEAVEKFKTILTEQGAVNRE